MTKPLSHVLRWVWLVSTLIMATTITAAYIRRDRASADRAAEGRFAQGAPLRRNLRTTDEIIAVFIGGSFCGATSMPGLREAVETLNRELASRAVAQGKTFVSVGVALDWSIQEGSSFLRDFGSFNEIVVGRNWLNSAVIQYIWRGIPGNASLPQMVLLERHVNVREASITVGEERLLARKVGVTEIVEWAAQRGAF